MNKPKAVKQRLTAQQAGLMNGFGQTVNSTAIHSPVREN